jgi:1-phosphofructokinase family hexose kinase
MKLPHHKESHPPIITVTLNPVVDLTFWVPHFCAGKTFLSERSAAYAGGKGVNTSRALLNLNITSTATGIIGEHCRKTYVDILAKEGITHDFYLTDGSVRTNVTILTAGERETHIRDRGSHLTAGTFKRFLHHFRELVSKAKKEMDPVSETQLDSTATKPLVILSGSIPENIPTESYRTLLHTAHKMGALSLLDTSGKPLRLGLEEKPFFIKPNRYEAEEALGFLPESEYDYRKAIESFHALGIELVMISRGSDGLYLSNGKRTVSASVNVERPVNTVGSGDAAVAGAVFGTINDLGIDDTARLSCALGAANTLVAGACIFESTHLQRLYKEVLVKML